MLKNPKGSLLQFFDVLQQWMLNAKGSPFNALGARTSTSSVVWVFRQFVTLFVGLFCECFDTFMSFSALDMAPTYAAPDLLVFKIAL